MYLMFFYFFFFQVRDYDFREHLSTIAPTEQRDMVLGNDANSWSYLYFPIFSASDLRIYKQCPFDVPTLNKRKKKVNWCYKHTSSGSVKFSSFLYFFLLSSIVTISFEFKVSPPPLPPPAPTPTKARGTSTRPATPTQPRRDSRLRKVSSAILARNNSCVYSTWLLWHAGFQASFVFSM